MPAANRPYIGRRRVAPPRRRPVFTRPPLVDWGRRYGAARGLYRVFGPAVYRFYRSSSGPPAETDTPFATSATLPATPGTSFADGTWYLSASYFNGVRDSGFLPIGAGGATYLKLVVASGGAGTVLPAAPLDVRLEQRAGGVVRVIALYAETGASRATTWAIAYTTNGTSPTPGAPSSTRSFRTTGSPELLVVDLPAQADGTTVKVLVQTRRGASTYSAPGVAVSILADASGPSEVPGGDLWAGDLPEGTD